MTRPARNKPKKIAIRSKRLDALDESQLALAIWLMARNIVEDQTSRPQDDVDSPATDAESPGRDAEAA